MLFLFSLLSLALLYQAAAFTPLAPAISQHPGTQHPGSVSPTSLYEYIPKGMSKSQWEAIKAKDNKNKGEKLGKTGVTSFKPRSFSDWQKSGGKNLFAVDPNSVKYAEEIPYMQRGGAPDDSDLQKKSPFDAFKNFGNKTAPPTPPPPKKNPWTF